ncbi:MAG: helix-turn-helix domain-containing protein [Geminicoccaceae bacterium]
MAPGLTLGRRLRALRVALDMSQVELARRIGRHQTAIGPYERDEYEPPREVVEKLALVLETSPEYLYFGRSPTQVALSVVGRIGRAGLLETMPEPMLELVRLRDQQMLGYRVLDDSMAPVFRPRQIVLALAGPEGDPDAIVGRDALVELADGRTLLRRLFPSATPGRYDLAAYNAPALPLVGVRSARSIAGVLWPDALRETEGERSA